MNTRGLRGLFKTNSSGDDVYFTLTVHFPLRKRREREIREKKKKNKKIRIKKRETTKENIAFIYGNQRLKESRPQGVPIFNGEDFNQ